MKDTGRAEYYNVTDEEALEGMASTLHFLCFFLEGGVMSSLLINKNKFLFQLFTEYVFIHGILRWCGDASCLFLPLLAFEA